MNYRYNDYKLKKDLISIIETQKLKMHVVFLKNTPSLKGLINNL